MENSSEEISHKKQVIVTKTSCYFCNEWLDSENSKNHIQHCGQVLEKCPNNCNAYIQRKLVDKHLLECIKNRSRKPMENGLISPEIEPIDIQPITTADIDRILEQRLLILENEISAIRSALHEETRQRHRLITDVGTVRKQTQEIEEVWMSRIRDILLALKRCLNDEISSRCLDIENCKIDIDTLIGHCQDVDKWHMEIEEKVNQFHTSTVLKSSEMDRVIETLITETRRLTVGLEQLKNETAGQKQQLAEHQIELHRTLTMTIRNDLLARLNDMNTKLSITTEQCRRMVEQTIHDLSNRLTNFGVEVRGMKNIVHETEDKCDKLEKMVFETRQMTYQTKQELIDLQIHLAHEKKLMTIHNHRGHLIWRIDNYAKQLQEAKSVDDLTIQSPMFCNRQYGYTLRLDISLNGFGTWKGRNLLACLSVVNGEWDPLLSWPCKLQADIILRDQSNQSNDISKTISVKRKSENYEQAQYIFITHKTLAKGSFILNDAVFFEVKVHKTRLD